MREPAFTPGPWQAEPMVPKADNAFYITACPDGHNSQKDVATVGPCLAPTTKPNAHLIAAAPALYEAARVAEQLALIASDWNLDEVEIDGEMRDIYDIRDIFKAALSLALGESPNA